MDLINKQVEHKKYGTGTITGFDGKKTIYIKFQNFEQPKPFLYPDTFNNMILRFSEPTASESPDDPIQTKGVESFFNDYNRALNDQYQYICKNGSKRYLVYEGRRVQGYTNYYVYVFETDEELSFPNGTDIRIWKDDKNYTKGSVIDCDDNLIILKSEFDLGPYVNFLEISTETWLIYKSLNDRFSQLSLNKTPIVQSLICDGKTQIDQTNNNISVGQSEAIRMANTQPITFIWGPPGTGKTTTLARIALEHITQNHRVLMLSHTRIAVDNAVWKLYQLNSSLPVGKIIRYGDATQEEIVNHPYLTSYQLAIRKLPDLQNEILTLAKEKKSLSRTSERFVKVSKRIKTLKGLIATEETNCTTHSQFIATTVAKASVDSAIYKQKFDVVIFDEASMAYIPQIIFAAGLAIKHFICIGDFYQLPPVVQGDSKLLSKDIFEYCGIVSAVHRKCNHKWLCLLNKQYRMHPDIANFTSRNMYHNLLITDPQTEIACSSIKNQGPINGKALAMVNLSFMMSSCIMTIDDSKTNILSALITFYLALEGAANYDVGIITPYRAQSRLFHAMATDAQKAMTNLHPIKCATVHEFQGSEKDMIFYDAVECYFSKFPGRLISDTKNNYANRLFNVALTRAKGKFIGITNVNYMLNAKLNTSLLFSKFMADYKFVGLDGNDIIKSKALLTNPTMNFYDIKRGNEKFLQDILAAKTNVNIDIPGTCKDTAFLNDLATALKTVIANKIKVTVRVEDKLKLPAALLPFATETKFISNAVTVIDKRIVWFGEPESEANFIVQNKPLQTKYRPIIRFEGSRTASLIYSFLKMRTLPPPPPQNSFSNYVRDNVKCPICKRPMQLKKGNTGKFFLACTGYPSCKTTDLVTINLVNNYFSTCGPYGKLCPICKHVSLLVKKGPYGLYIECGNLGIHKFKLDQI